MAAPSRVRDLHPFRNLDGVLGALHTSDDGHVDASGVTQAIAAVAADVQGASRCSRTGQLPSGQRMIASSRLIVD